MGRTLSVTLNCGFKMSRKQYHDHRNALVGPETLGYLASKSDVINTTYNPPLYLKRVYIMTTQARTNVAVMKTLDYNERQVAARNLKNNDASIQEIAKQLDIPESSVRSLLT